MQLIRVSTDRADSVFDAQLQEDVELPANITVALQPLTCVPARDTLTVGDRNDDIVYQLTQAGRAALPPGRRHRHSSQQRCSARQHGTPH
jgi:hypothetical protein